MAHPKRKISKTRRDKRRTHIKAEKQQISICKATGESHLYHRAHWHEESFTTGEKFQLIPQNQNKTIILRYQFNCLMT